MGKEISFETAYPLTGAYIRELLSAHGTEVSNIGPILYLLVTSSRNAFPSDVHMICAAHISDLSLPMFPLSNLYGSRGWLYNDISQVEGITVE